jgi:hypothetical protein
MAGDTGIAAVVATGSKGAADLFVTLYDFFTTSGSTVAGIKLIANSTGSNGLGMGYWDSVAPVGNNAWAVFTFLSASIPFYMLMQYATASSAAYPFGLVPGNPGRFANFGTNYAAYGGLGMQFAVRSDGASPWTGTTNADGTDTKADPVWTTGECTDNAAAYVWPRTNSTSGSAALTAVSGSRERCTSIAGHSYMNGPNGVGVRLHLACNFNNVAIARNSFTLNATGSYNYMWFGEYKVYSGSWPVGSSTLSPAVPYAMLWKNTEGAQNPTITATTYGSLTGDTDFEGGIAHPSLRGQVVSCLNGTLSNIPFTAGFHPNWAYNTGSSHKTYDEFPIQLYMYEHLNTASVAIRDCFGLMGETDYLRYVYGLFVGDIASGSNDGITSGSAVGQLRTIMGSYPTTTQSSKYSFPWSPNVPDSFLSGGVNRGFRTGSYY